MNNLTQLAILLLICLIGELFSYILPLPATMIALILLFILLKTRVLKLGWVESISDILLKYMPIMFVPAGVKLINDFKFISSVWVEVLLVSIISTVIVFAITAYTVKFILLLKERRAK